MYWKPWLVDFQFGWKAKTPTHNALWFLHLYLLEEVCGWWGQNVTTQEIFLMFHQSMWCYLTCITDKRHEFYDEKFLIYLSCSTSCQSLLWRNTRICNCLIALHLCVYVSGHAWVEAGFEITKSVFSSPELEGNSTQQSTANCSSVHILLSISTTSLLLLLGFVQYFMLTLSEPHPSKCFLLTLSFWQLDLHFSSLGGISSQHGGYLPDRLTL